MIKFFIAISLHIGLGDGWNQIHPGIRFVENQWSLGAYLNSERNVSLFGAYTFENGPWFAELGVVTNYTQIPVIPFVRGGYEISENTRLFIAPGFAGKQGGIVIGIEHRFGGGL